MLACIATAQSGRGLLLVGIGGHGCSGKTTLARSIAGAIIVATEEFWDGREFRMDRLRREVIDPLRCGDRARYAGWDRSAGGAAETPAEAPAEAPAGEAAVAQAGLRTIEPSGVVVIDGVCALHRMLRDAYDVRIWVDAPRAVRLARALARDGECAREAWEEHWIPSEERYVAQDDPIGCADLVVDGCADPVVDGCA